MSDTKKFINIQEDVLIEWIYNNGNITENYSIWSDIKTQSRNFVSKSNYNSIDYTLFNIDPVLKKYSKVDVSKFNFLKIQDYFTAPLQYDKVNIHFPFNYDFGDYIGLLFKVYAFDFLSKKTINFSNYFYDKTDINIEKLMQLNKPFRYGEKEWGKYLTISIPSIDEISNNRIITSTTNKPTPDSINANITSDNVGVSITTPIFIELSFITTRETVLGTTYYYLGDTFNTSISKTPEYQSLGVTVRESTQWDFFEIFGFYNNSNENLDNFIRDLEDSGRRINIEYIVTIYEENLQSGFPIKFLVTENFSQKIEYRPIFKYSNTTASIDVEMNIIDLVDNTTIIRTTSLGLTKNLFKYGKKLSRLQIDTLNKPKIYNYRSDNAITNNTNISAINTYGITKVPYPLLISNYKILLSITKSQDSTDDYKSLGTMTLLLTPFDNIIKFKIAKQIDSNGTPESYDMAEILSNSKLTLIFKSDTEMIEKEIFRETDENNIEEGIVIFKVLETDVKIIKGFKNIDNNFYLTIVGNNTRTLLYSGKFKIYEDVKFLEEKTNVLLPTEPRKIKSNTVIEDNSSSNSKTSDTGSKTSEDVKPRILKTTTDAKSKKFYIDAKIKENDLFKEENLPIRTVSDESELNYHKNLIINVKKGASTLEKSLVKSQIEQLGLSIYSEVDETITVERVHVSKIRNVEQIGNINNVTQLGLDFGWGDITPPTPIKSEATTAAALPPPVEPPTIGNSTVLNNTPGTTEKSNNNTSNK